MRKPLTQDAWKDELEAQIEEHGARSLELYLESDILSPVYITDVQFKGDCIVVVLNNE